MSTTAECMRGTRLKSTSAVVLLRGLVCEALVQQTSECMVGVREVGRGGEAGRPEKQIVVVAVVAELGPPALCPQDVARASMQRPQNSLHFGCEPRPGACPFHVIPKPYDIQCSHEVVGCGCCNGLEIGGESRPSDGCPQAHFPHNVAQNSNELW